MPSSLEDFNDDLGDNVALTDDGGGFWRDPNNFLNVLGGAGDAAGSWFDAFGLFGANNQLPPNFQQPPPPQQQETPAWVWIIVAVAVLILIVLLVIALK